MGGAVYASSYLIHRMLGQVKLASFADLFLSIPLGLTVLWLACRAMGVPELEEAITALAGPLRRRLPFLRRP